MKQTKADKMLIRTYLESVEHLNIVSKLDIISGLASMARTKIHAVGLADANIFGAVIKNDATSSRHCENRPKDNAISERKNHDQ